MWFTERWKCHTRTTKTACCSTGVPTRGLKGGVVRSKPSTGRQVEGRVALLTSFRDPPGEWALLGRVILGSVRLKQDQIHGP